MSDEQDEVDERADEKLAAILAEQEGESPAPALALGPGLHEDVPHDAYHADCADGISLSSSIASEIADRSAWHGWRLHPKLGGQKVRATRAMNHGSLVHMMLLGSGPDLCVVEAKDYRTNKAKDAKKAAEAAGQVPILAGELVELQAIVGELHARLRARGIDLVPLVKEVTGIWREQNGVLCRMRADAWDPETGTIYDVKFLSDAEPKAFARHMMDHGCDVQDAAYRSGFGTLFPELDGRLRMKFVVIEQKTGAIMIGRPGGGMRQLGEGKWSYAVERFRACLEANKWPGYNDDEEVDIEAPDWALRRLEAGLAGGSKAVPF